MSPSGRGAQSPRGGGGGNGRVFEAIAGNENWHRAPHQAPPRRQAPRANEKLLASGAASGGWEEEQEEGGGPAAVSHYRVTFSPRVLVRARPSLGAACLGARERGEVVRCTAQHRAQEGEAWVRLAEGFRESKRWREDRDLEAWMMVEHPQLGPLMKHAGGCPAPDLPCIQLQLPSSSDTHGRSGATAAGRHRAVAHYKVIHSPSVMVRDKPNMSGKIVGALKPGTVVRTKGSQGNWLKLDTGDGSGDGQAPQASWIMCRHTELGVFAERCQPDGSSYYF